MERPLACLACSHRHKLLLAPLLQRKAIPATLRSFLASNPSESGCRKYSDPNLVIMFNILERRVQATLGRTFKAIPSILGPPLCIVLLAGTHYGQLLWGGAVCSLPVSSRGTDLLDAEHPPGKEKELEFSLSGHVQAV